MSDEQRPVALITGASRGIGRATAIQLSKDGYCVVINYCRSGEAAAEVQATIAADGGQSHVCQFDVSDMRAVQESIKRITGEIGLIDVLVNNAATGRGNPLVRVKQEEWDTTLATNLSSMYYTTNAMLKTWTSGRCGRRIINLTSIGGETGFLHSSVYGASKAGIIGFTKCLAVELGRKGVTVNAISPGLISTEGSSIIPQEAVLAKTPLGRAGLPEEVAYLVSFLASDRASFITGQVIRINGGVYT